MSGSEVFGDILGRVGRGVGSIYTKDMGSFGRKVLGNGCADACTNVLAEDQLWY
jgi:hypothetical protein